MPLYIVYFSGVL